MSELMETPVTKKKLEIPAPADIEAAIAEHLAEINRLRRLLKVAQEMTGAEAK